MMLNTQQHGVLIQRRAKKKKISYIRTQPMLTCLKALTLLFEKKDETYQTQEILRF